MRSALAMYDYGEGVPKIIRKLKWYRLSAEHGNAKAPFNLGVMYYNEKECLKIMRKPSLVERC